MEKDPESGSDSSSVGIVPVNGRKRKAGVKNRINIDDSSTENGIAVNVNNRRNTIHVSVDIHDSENPDSSDIHHSTNMSTINVCNPTNPSDDPNGNQEDNEDSFPLVHLDEQDNVSYVSDGDDSDRESNNSISGQRNDGNNGNSNINDNGNNNDEIDDGDDTDDSDDYDNNDDTAGIIENVDLLALYEKEVGDPPTEDDANSYDDCVDLYNSCYDDDLDNEYRGAVSNEELLGLYRFNNNLTRTIEVNAHDELLLKTAKKEYKYVFEKVELQTETGMHELTPFELFDLFFPCNLVKEMKGWINSRSRNISLIDIYSFIRADMIMQFFGTSPTTMFNESYNEYFQVLGDYIDLSERQEQEAIANRPKEYKLREAFSEDKVLRRLRLSKKTLHVPVSLRNVRGTGAQRKDYRLRCNMCCGAKKNHREKVKHTRAGRYTGVKCSRCDVALCKPSDDPLDESTCWHKWHTQIKFKSPCPPIKTTEKTTPLSTTDVQPTTTEISTQPGTSNLPARLSLDALNMEEIQVNQSPSNSMNNIPLTAIRPRRANVSSSNLRSASTTRRRITITPVHTVVLRRSPRRKGNANKR